MSHKPPIRILAGLALVLMLGVGGYWRTSAVHDPVQCGETMGTTYSIKIAGPVKRSLLKDLTSRIDAQLVQIGRQMSTWDPASEISRFNRRESTDPFPVSEAFTIVVRRSLELAEATHGTFDPTLQPLLDLWGFGSGAEFRKVPTIEQVAAAKALTGWRKLSIEESGMLQKSIPNLSLDLGAIAKGYGVDVIANILEEAGLTDYFVEIGGEVVVRGKNPESKPWRIGIQFPGTNPMDSRLWGIIHLEQGAVATSGDYRNYILEDGLIHSHILDPKTGQAAFSTTASVTVVAPACIDADGMATALFVMGTAEGLAWVEDRPGVEALFLERGENGELFEKISSGFAAATRYSPCD